MSGYTAPVDAKCPECGGVAILNEDVTEVKCHRCGFESEYEEYLETMKEAALNMAADYIPDRPGM